MSFRRACLLISILAVCHSCTATGVRISTSKRRWWPQKEISISINQRHEQKVAKGSHAAAQNTALDLHASEGIILWCWAVSCNRQHADLLMAISCASSISDHAYTLTPFCSLTDPVQVMILLERSSVHSRFFCAYNAKLTFDITLTSARMA